MTNENEDEKRMKVNLLGRDLGTASGWDGDPGETIWFYDFEPLEGINLTKGTLQFDFVEGNLEVQDEDQGIVNLPLDMISFLQGVPRS